MINVDSTIETLHEFRFSIYRLLSFEDESISLLKKTIKLALIKDRISNELNLEGLPNNEETRKIVVEKINTIVSEVWNE